MAGRKRGLSREEIVLLLEEELYSTSEFADRNVDVNNTSSSSEYGDDDDSDGSQKTVDYSADSPFAWCDSDPFPLVCLPFTGSSGLQVDVTNIQYPLECFNLFITEDSSCIYDRYG